MSNDMVEVMPGTSRFSAGFSLVKFDRKKKLLYLSGKLSGSLVDTAETGKLVLLVSFNGSELMPSSERVCS